MPLGLESHFGPVRHEWLYLNSSKITETLKPYIDDNVGDAVSGDTVGRDYTGLNHDFRNVHKYVLNTSQLKHSYDKECTT